MQLPYDRDQPDWGSRTSYPDGTKLPFDVDKIVIHWGGGTDPDGDDDIPTEGEEAAILRSWQRFHIDGKGWSDIAYNYGIGNTGLLYRLRGWNRSGATSGDIDQDGIPENQEAVALVWIGGTAGRPSVEAFQAMGQLVRAIYRALGWDLTDGSKVTVHSDHKATACPGDEWRAWRDRKGWLDGVPPAGEVDEFGLGLLAYGAGSKASPSRPVMALQVMLAAAGFPDGNSIDPSANKADGIFRSGTRTALARFQDDAAVPVTGTSTVATWRALAGTK